MENLVKNSEIEKFIYEIRGQHVMLDFDLARLYGAVMILRTWNLNNKQLNVSSFDII